MRTRRVMALIGAAVATALVFFSAGRLTRGGGGWERQHVNKSRDSKEFRNSFLGVCDAKGFDRLRPTFDGIVSAVRLD